MNLRDLPYFERWFIVGLLIGVLAATGALALYFGIKFFEELLLGDVLGVQLPHPVGEGGPLNFVYSPTRYIFLPLVVGLGGAVSGLLTYTFSPEAAGGGTDFAINSYHKNNGRVRLRAVPVKLLASAVTIGSGGSGGREGPTSMIVAGLSSNLINFLRLGAEDRRRAVAIGIGAGIGTIFKSPIGGAILAGELLYKRDIEPEVIFPAVVASAVGYSIFGVVTGFEPIFGYYLQPFSPLRLPLYAFLGVVTGGMSIFYVKTMELFTSRFKALRTSRYVKPAIGGLAAGALALGFPEVMANGYGWVQILMDGKFGDIPTYGVPLLLILISLPFVKVISTSFTVGSGGSGGDFAPGIVIGASTGAVYGYVLHLLLPSVVPSVAPFVIVGMLSLFGAAAKAPLSVTLMVVEMTGGLQLLPGMMIAVAVAYLLSGGNTIYGSQVPTRRDSPVHAGEYNVPLLRSIRVSELQLRDTKLLSTMGSSDARKAIQDSGLFSLPVVDNEGKFLGSVFLSELPASKEPVVNFVRSGVSYVNPSSTAEDAMEVMVRSKSRWAPVVEKGVYKGIVTLDDVLTAYDKKLREMSVKEKT
ncbi:chloride channel protein [Sulfodiicoccus acidiphilus]|uniref:Chloride channel protein n=1 Tax=Sulfodiicoccus acidiphilus TaxID=1670455 RepID=A0A348B690_9CREN|nr:chloride channel protein [Sulfodiicoccus acidiphilus]BBD73692.1 chloride channel protein [Sulfodiicoccus acidiphilus]GGT97698.1 chloride channel protein [Sulfodiicoccus acidiphilus]